MSITAEQAQVWRPIETAPMDGTRVMLWRGSPHIGTWAEMVIAEWYDGAWSWPTDNPSTHGEWSPDDLVNGYYSREGFTHWMPLPATPAEGSA